MSDEPRDSLDGNNPGAESNGPGAQHNGRGDAPGDSPAGTAPGTSGEDSSAPWERPRRWNHEALDATRVDDLLARLGSPDDAPIEGRRRRRQADDSDVVSASDLIAALSGPESGGNAGSTEAPSADAPANLPEAVTEFSAPGTSDPHPAATAVTSPADGPTEVASPIAGAAQAAPEPFRPDDATVFLPTSTASHTPDQATPPDQTVLLPPRIGPGQSAPIRDLDDPNSRTDFIPKLTGSAADRAEADSIRAALSRQSGLTTTALLGAGGGPPPPHSGGKKLEHSDGPPRRRKGLLYAGRSIAAVVAFVTLLGMGVEWNIKDRADTTLKQQAVVALLPSDTHISKPRTVPTVVTNSKGVKTTESVKPATVYQPENILLLGSDTRAGGNAALGGTDSSTADSANSDTLMIAHLSGDRQHVTILSIPRDTVLQTPACRAWDLNTGKFVEQTPSVHGGTISHINTLYGVGGPQCTVAGVQSLTGLGISRYIGIDFEGFQAMVDALGGITLNICAPVIDSELGTVANAGGVHVVQGAEALNLVRARHVQGETGSDLARIHRQQVVLSAILRQVTQAGTLLNPSKLDNFLQAFTKNTFTDNVTLEDLVTLAGSLGSLDPAHVTFYTLPTIVRTDGGDGLEVDPTKAPAIFDALTNDLPLPGEVTTPATTKATTTPLTPAPTKAAVPNLKLTVAPAKVNLEIYNLTGQANVAGTARTALNEVGFAVTEDQLFKPDTDTQTGTTVLYDSKNRAAALTVAAAVPDSTLVVTPGLGSTVRLLLGTGYAGLVKAVKVGDTAPPSLSTAVSTGSSIDTTSSGNSSTVATTTLGSTDLSSVNAAAGTCA